MIRDVIVVGSGPGGAIAAATLAQAGKSVLLVDRQPFPRDKICGDGISIQATEMMLQQFNIGPDKIDFNYQSVNSILIKAPSGQVITVPEYSTGLCPMVVPRLTFDNLLHQHARRCGARFEVMQIKGPLYASNNANGNQKVVGVIERRGRDYIEHEARVVIAADGASSAIASSVRGRVSDPEETAIAMRAYARLKNPLPTASLARFSYLTHLSPGYAWVFPVTNTRVNIGIGAFDQAVYKQIGKNLKTLLDEFVQEMQAEIPMEIEPGTVKAWPIPIWTSNESRVVKGAYLVGDAGRFVDALTGAGIYPAMKTGQLAAQSAIRILNGESEQQAALNYDTNWRTQIGGSLRKYHLLQRCIGSKPFVFNALVTLTNAIPLLQRPLLKGLAGHHT